MDVLVKIVVRLDNTVNALREDVRALWSSQRDLRQRLEAVEGPRAMKQRSGRRGTRPALLRTPVIPLVSASSIRPH
jgi:hypothetical protein